MATETGVRERREMLVREHMKSENRHHFDVTLETYFDAATVLGQLGLIAPAPSLREEAVEANEL